MEVAAVSLFNVLTSPHQLLKPSSAPTSSTSLPLSSQNAQRLGGSQQTLTTPVVSVATPSLLAPFSSMQTAYNTGKMEVRLDQSIDGLISYHGGNISSSDSISRSVDQWSDVVSHREGQELGHVFKHV